MEKDIIRLLDNQNQIVLRMLEFISESSRWYSVNEISLELDVVERTVQRYIHQLEEMIEAYNQERQHQLTITYEKYKGVLLEIDHGSNYMEFKSYILENDDTMKVFKDIIFEDFYSIKRYTMTNYVSETAVRKSIKKIKDFLSIYQLGLSRNNFKLIGDEKQIRLVIYIISWVIFKGVTWPFESIDKKKTYDTVDRFSDKIGLNFSEIHRKQMAYMLALNLIRLRKNHVIQMEEEWKDYVDVPKLMDSLPLLKTFVYEYNIHIESEIYFYVLLVQVKMKIYESEDFKNRIFSYHKKKNSDIYLATTTFTKIFSEQIVPIPKDIEERFFITSFCAHLFCKLFRQVQVDVDGYLVLSEVDNEYPMLRDKLNHLIDTLYKETNNYLFLEKEFLVQKYILLFSSILPLTHYEPPITIFLDTDLPYFVKKSIVVRLTDRYKHDFNVSFSDKSNDKDYDMVLTNIPNLMEEKERFSHSVHLFDFPIKMRDFAEIERKLKIISQLKSQYVLD